MTPSDIYLPLLAILLFLIAIVLWRTARFPTQVQGEVDLPDGPTPDVDSERVADHLSQAIRLETISYPEGPSPASQKALLAMHALLERLYPRVHSTLKKEVVNGYSLLYTWEGAQPDLPPALFLAHLDVVPAEKIPVLAGMEQSLRDAAAAGQPGALWKYPPFSGQVADGFVWGRGAMDDKCNVIGLLEAVESLLRAGFHSQRTVYLAFGHDEEVGGREGGRRIAALLEQRGVRLNSVIDEGGSVIEGVLPSVKAPIALVGTNEKGYLSLALSVESMGGHSSTPPAHTAIGVLAGAIQRLETYPFPASFKAVAPMLRCMGPALPWWAQLVLANLWLTRGVAVRLATGFPPANAMIRTTQAVTMIQGGVKDNILPPRASAVAKFRILAKPKAASTRAW
jgi:carboxypeptidase PM20D1